MHVFLQVGIVIDNYIRHAILELNLGRRQDPWHFLINTWFVKIIPGCGKYVSCFCSKSINTKPEKLFSWNDQNNVSHFDGKCVQFKLCKLWTTNV